MSRVINMNLYKCKDPDCYIAQHPRYKEILISGGNIQQVKNNVQRCLHGYIQAWPETKRRFFTNNKMLDIKFTRASTTLVLNQY